jgi:hypothetical protein
MFSKPARLKLGHLEDLRGICLAQQFQVLPDRWVDIAFTSDACAVGAVTLQQLRGFEPMLAILVVDVSPLLAATAAFKCWEHAGLPSNC